MKKILKSLALCAAVAAASAFGAATVHAQSSYMGPVLDSYDTNCENDYQSFRCSVYSLQPDAGYVEVVLVEPYDGTATQLFKMRPDNFIDVWMYFDGQPMTYEGLYEQTSNNCTNALPAYQQPRHAALAVDGGGMSGLCIW